MKYECMYVMCTHVPHVHHVKHVSCEEVYIVIILQLTTCRGPHQEAFWGKK